jgi:hypothetical protein
MRRFAISLALLASAAVAAGDEVIWSSSEVRVTLLPDGALSVADHGNAFIRDGVTVVKRAYSSYADDRVTAVRVVRIEPDGREVPERFTSPWNGAVQWNVSSGGPPQRVYRIETRVTGVVIPIWGICCPRRQRETFTSPIGRLKEITSFWRESGSHPLSRYVLNYQYLFPDQQEPFNVQPSLAFGPQWKPVHPIAPGSVGSDVPPEPFGIPGSYRFRHVFDYAGGGRPAAVDILTPLFRDLSVTGFPILAILIWFAYLRRFVLRPKISEIDERWLSEHLFNEDAEVIGARWSGRPAHLTIERFLRRLERQGKVALDIGRINEDTDDEDFVVSIRLRVARNQFEDFERLVIDELIPKGNEIDSRDLRRTHANRDFDPMARAQEWLSALARKNSRLQKTSLASRAFSFALFFTGFALLVADVTRRQSEAVVLLSPWLLIMLVAFWPSRFVWRLTRKWRYGGLLLWIPILIMLAVVVLVHTAIAEGLGLAGSIGILLACVGAYHATVADAAKSGGTEVQRMVDLAAAEAWFRRELRSAHPRIRKEWQPYVAAFGLSDEERESEGEDWGWALQTHAA